MNHDLLNYIASEDSECIKIVAIRLVFVIAPVAKFFIHSDGLLQARQAPPR